MYMIHYGLKQGVICGGEERREREVDRRKRKKEQEKMNPFLALMVC
jgi:hypothetical protein